MFACQKCNPSFCSYGNYLLPRQQTVGKGELSCYCTQCALQFTGTGNKARWKWESHLLWFPSAGRKQNLKNGRLHSPSLVSRDYEDSLNPQCENPLENRKKQQKKTNMQTQVNLSWRSSKSDVLQIQRGYKITKKVWVTNHVESGELGSFKWQSSTE